MTFLYSHLQYAYNIIIHSRQPQQWCHDKLASCQHILFTASSQQTVPSDAISCHSYSRSSVDNPFVMTTATMEFYIVLNCVMTANLEQLIALRNHERVFQSIYLVLHTSHAPLLRHSCISTHNVALWPSTLHAASRVQTPLAADLYLVTELKAFISLLMVPWLNYLTLQLGKEEVDGDFGIFDNHL